MSGRSKVRRGKAKVSDDNVPSVSDDDMDEDLDDLDDEEEEEEEEEEVEPEDEPEEDDDEDEDEEPDESEEEEEDDFEDDVELDLDDDLEEPSGEPIFEEEAGYAEGFDWQSLSEEDRQRHLELLAATPEQLAEVPLKKLSPFDRWAVAQAQARAGLRADFQESCRSILKARKRHEALMYEDIYLELISDLADAKEFDEAFGWLDKFHKAFPGDADIFQRVRGLLLIESGQIHEGRTLLDELMSRADDHGELHLEIGDDLLAMGHPELALRILARGKDFARQNRDTELMTAIDETRRLALQRIEGEEH